MLNRRQIEVQHQNLACMCRITVKSLIDYACVNTHVDEDCEEFVNFCAVFEQMVSHRIRPYQKKVWHRGQGAQRHFWQVLLENHRHGPLFRSCIPNIESIESIKSPRAKLRAFVRVALMEKRLSDYLYWLHNNSTLMADCYLDGALFVSEEGLELCGEIIGLSAIDFNFCLRGNENELLGPLEVNYAPFLNYTQSSASRLIDEEEMLQLSGKSPEGANITDNFSKRQTLEDDFRRAKEQKDYLEELVRLRERQTGEANARVETMRETVRLMGREWEAEKMVLDECILELQQEISTLRNQNSLLKSQVSELQVFKSRIDFNEVPMVDLAYVPATSASQEQVQDETENNQNQPSAILPMQDTSSQMSSSDQKSIMSGISDQIRLKEDTQSLIPLTGSLADVNIAMLRDVQMNDEAQNDWKKRDLANVSTPGGSKVRDGYGDVEMTAIHTAEEQLNKQTTTTTTTTASVATLEVTTVSASSSPTLTSVSSVTSSSSSVTNTTVSDETATVKDCNVESSTVTSQTTRDDDSLSQASSDVTPGLKEDLKHSMHDINVDENNEQREEDTKHDEEIESSSHPSLAAGSETGGGVSMALQDLEKAFNTDDPEQDKFDSLQISSDSNGGDGNGNGLEEANTSSASEPEILDRVNTSSEGSDAAWEMLSDHEEPEQGTK